MNILENLVFTDIKTPGVVHSEKGRDFKMEKRVFWGLSLCLSGQITYTMNGKRFVSDKNVAVLLPKGGTYTLYGDKEGLFPVINFNCNGLDSDEIMVFPLSDPEACISDFNALTAMFGRNESRLKIYGVFYELLNRVSTAKEQKNRLLEAVFHYVEKNISDLDLSNEILAKQVGISEVYLRKLFMNYCGTTPKQYVLDMRIKMAKQQLVSTSSSISDIAEGCGFSSVYHFCRSFKQRVGLTPTQYATSNRVYKI
ncbi:MAG: helix-turn-helix transcriptional regulator [Clostridia bacterium]|nr:helix-turn-helix transcriptional regulator [Clostridia bacterium]